MIGTAGMILTNLGVIDDFSIGQRLARVNNHSRLWDPARTHISSSAGAVGYPAMYLTLHINWDKHKPLWSRTPLAAAPHLPSPAATHSISTSTVVLPPPEQFTPPMSLNSPTPESIKIISKPSMQRWMGVQQLMALRRQTRPGIFLLSTPQGLLTDIDCELRGVAGTLLAHLALPLGHVVALRGLLRAKHQAELAAALPPGTSLDNEQALLRAKQRAVYVPLAEWDARSASARGLAGRVSAAQQDSKLYFNMVEYPKRGVDLGHHNAAVWQQRDELLNKAGRLLEQLFLQEEVLRQQGSRSAGDSSSSSSSDTGGGGGGRFGRDRRSPRGRGGSSSSSSSSSSRGQGGRQALFVARGQQQQQQQQQQQGEDRWRPDSSGSSSD